MQVVVEFPPMYEEMAKVFDLSPGRGVIFAWGNKIYNPDNIDISRELVRHESIHGSRQGKDGEIVRWWQRYLLDPQFRLAEELPAHKAEYLEFCKTHGDRNKRARFLNSIAERLASPLYGSLLTPKRAIHEIMIYR